MLNAEDGYNEKTDINFVKGITNCERKLYEM